MLVRPFIQPIKAFDASTSTGTANVCILGGDIITTLNYQIYQGDTLIYSGSVSVTDNGGSAIRTFPIYLSQSMGLANNGSYTMRAWTSNSTDTSAYSSVALFYCYVTPTITLKDSNNTTITSSYVFTAQSGTLTVNFAKNDNNSIATLNTFSMNIFGVDSNGNLNLVYDSGDVYTPFAVAYDNLTPTSGESVLYESYQINWTSETTQGMSLGGDITGLSCSYPITEDANLIKVENDSKNGRIKVSFSVGDGQFGDIVQTPLNVSNFGAAIDEENIYLGGQYSSKGAFVVYDKRSEQFGDLIENPFVSSSTLIMSLDVDADYVYCGGKYGEFAIYNKSTGSFGSLIPNPINSNQYGAIYSVCADKNYVYCGGAVQGEVASLDSAFVLYDKSTGTFGSLVNAPQFIISTYNHSYIAHMVQDEANVYCCSAVVNDRSGELAVYNKSTGTFGSVLSAPLKILSMCVDSDCVYLGGVGGRFAKYYKTGSFSGYISTGLGNIVSVAVDSSFVYLGDATGKLLIYNKRDGSLGDIHQSDLSVIHFVADINNIYGHSGTALSVFHRPNISIRRKDISSGASTEEPITLISGFGGTLANLVGSPDLFFYDRYQKNNSLYEYSIVSTLFGVSTVQSVQVLSQFCKSYIADGDKGYELYEEWGVDNFQRNQKTAIYEPYGAKYPFIAYNAVTNYDSGSDTAIYRAPTNVGQQYLDSVAQAQYTKQLRDFLTNRKVKVRKTESGDIALVATLNAVPNTYSKEMGNTLATTQFEWVEVGDFTDEDFKKLGITNSFTLYAQ